MYTLLYLKWITVKILLYSTKNSAQCFTLAWTGGEFGGEWIHAYVWVSPFTVHLKLSYQLYAPIQNKSFFKKIKIQRNPENHFCNYMIKTVTHKNHQCVYLRGNFDEEQGICTALSSPHKLLISYGMVEGGMGRRYTVEYWALS